MPRDFFTEPGHGPRRASDAQARAACIARLFALYRQVPDIHTECTRCAAREAAQTPTPAAEAALLARATQSLRPGAPPTAGWLGQRVARLARR